MGSVPGLGRSPREEHGNPLQYYGLENIHGQRSLVGYSPWGHKELDMTEGLSTSTPSPMVHRVANSLTPLKWLSKQLHTWRVVQILLFRNTIHACVYMLSSCLTLLWPPGTVVYQAPLPMEFSRQEYSSGLPLPPPGNLTDPGMEYMSPTSSALTGRFFTTEPPGKM